jgi:transposase
MTLEEAYIRIQELEEKISVLLETISNQHKKIAQLEKELSFYRTKKNSSNSSTPPSHDLHRVRRTESLRERSGRKPGGQPGHEGSCLEITNEPTTTEDHSPNYCQCCGEDLSDVAAELVGKRQVIDIPPIQPTITEHRIYGKKCQCGHVTEGDYPSEAHSPVCYGNNLSALTSYFHTRQYLSYDRMKEMYSDVFGLSISCGSLVNIIKSFAKKSLCIYELIRQRVSESDVVGADETGNRVCGKNAWAWVFQTSTATYIHSDKSRGKAVIDKIFPKGFPKSILVHDCWSSYFGVQTKEHQICIAHLLRDLKYLTKLYPQQQWSENFKSLLCQAIELKKSLFPIDFLKPIEKRKILEQQIDYLLAQNINQEYKKLETFKQRMIQHRDCLFQFLYYHNVPPDNNASERAVRTFKVKQKVSGLFRSEDGARNFAVIRSIIDTIIKNRKNIMEGITLINNLDSS